MRLPRIRLRTLMIAVAVAALVASLFAPPRRLPSGIWYDRRAVPLTFAVVDAESGAAIPCASVTIYDSRGSRWTSGGRTDAGGRATIAHEFPISGVHDPLGRRIRATVDYGFWDFEVKAPGYRDERAVLVHRVVLPRTGDSRLPRPIRVELVPDPPEPE
jgi:hypothetical protein